MLAALGSYPALESESRRLLLALAAAAAVVALSGALLGRWPALIPIALTISGGAYAGLLGGSGQIDLGATTALYAGGLLLVAELAYAALEPEAARDDRGLLLHRIGDLLVVVAGAVFASALVLVASEADLAGGLAWEAVGVVAATMTVALVAWLAWRGAPR